MVPPAAHARRPASAAGFSLLEMLVAVAIVAILAAIAIPQLLRSREKSKVAAMEELYDTPANSLGVILEMLNQGASYQCGGSGGGLLVTNAAEAATCFIDSNSHIKNPRNRNQVTYIEPGASTFGQIQLLGTQSVDSCGATQYRVAIIQRLNAGAPPERSYAVQIPGYTPLCP